MGTGGRCIMWKKREGGERGLIYGYEGRWCREGEKWGRQWSVRGWKGKRIRKVSEIRGGGGRRDDGWKGKRTFWGG